MNMNDINVTRATTSAIVSKGILVDLTVSKRTGVRTDAQATESVHQQYNTTGNAGRYAKKLFPQDPPELKAIGAVANAATAMHNALTLPWSTGWRILPRELHGKYSAEILAFRSKMDDAVRELVAALPRLKAEAAVMLGALYRENDYPSPQEFGASYGIAVSFMPVPDVGDFRVELDAEALADLRRAYEGDMQASIATATRDAFSRLEKVIQVLSDACSRVDERVESGAKLAVMRKAVVENIHDLVEVLPTLNVGGDPALDAMCAEVSRKFATLDVNELRDHADARADAKAKADAILKKMSAFIRR